MKHFSILSLSASLAVVAALALVPAAQASPISALGDLSGASSFGTGTIGSSSFTAAPGSTASAGSGSFTSLAPAIFTDPQAFVTFATNSGSAFNFTTAGIPTVNSLSSSALTGGALFMSETYNGITLQYWVTAVYQDILGTTNGTGSLWLLGYVKETGYADTTDVSLQITNSSTGTGAKSYSFELSSPAVGSITPEPNSLVLLGTGIFCMAGFLFYRRNSIA